VIEQETSFNHTNSKHSMC